MIFPRIIEISSFIPIVIGLCFAIGLLQWQRPVSLKKLSEMVFSKALGGMLLTVFAIRLYGAFISSELPCGGSSVLAMRQELCDIGIPVMLIIMIIPFISGFTTGIALGFVGASFPIVFNLLGNEPSTSELLATNVLAFGFGYMGMILSPVHVCLIVSNQHFKTSIAASLKGLIKPAAVMLAFTLVYYLLLSLNNVVI